MFYVFTEAFGSARGGEQTRKVECVAFYLTANEAREHAMRFSFGYYASKWDCSYTDQQAVKEKGWWN